MHKISRKKWRNTSADMKISGPSGPGSTWPEGQRGIVKWVDGSGTCLVPCEVVTCPVCDGEMKGLNRYPAETCDKCKEQA